MQIYDYIIVGAGSAGCALARGLSDDPDNKVLLLEAGPPANKFWVKTPAGMAKLYFDKKLNWNYYTDPMPELLGRRMYWPRGKGLGGSSSINGMIFIRGHRQDFENWKRLGNSEWGYDDVLPYFKRIEHNERGADQYRGTAGPLWVSDPAAQVQSCSDFVESAVRLGIERTADFNGAVHDGVGFIQHTIRRGRRHSAYMAFVEPVLGRANLTVRTGCLARKILFDQKQAVGVEVSKEGELQRFFAAREVILSAGSLNSPQLLMLSGIGPQAELQRHGLVPLVDRPGVGRNLQDHFYMHCAYQATPDSSYNRSLTGWRKYWQGARYLATQKGYLALGSSLAAAFVKSRAEEEYADLQISFRPMTFSYHPSCRSRSDARNGRVSLSFAAKSDRLRNAAILRSSPATCACTGVPDRSRGQ